MFDKIKLYFSTHQKQVEMVGAIASVIGVALYIKASAGTSLATPSVDATTADTSAGSATGTADDSTGIQGQLDAITAAIAGIPTALASGASAVGQEALSLSYSINSGTSFSSQGDPTSSSTSSKGSGFSLGGDVGGLLKGIGLSFGSQNQSTSANSTSDPYQFTASATNAFNLADATLTNVTQSQQDDLQNFLTSVGGTQAQANQATLAQTQQLGALDALLGGTNQTNTTAATTQIVNTATLGNPLTGVFHASNTITSHPSA